MTDKEIIKALECCFACRRPEDCTDCPYVECTAERGCVSDLTGDVLDLIKRQKAEIERLEKELNTLTKQCYKSGIKEFAKRVKESPRKISMMSFTEEGISTYVPVHAIDNLVKEMTEGV